MSELYRELDTPTFRLAVAQFEEAAERLGLDRNLRERLKIPQRALIVSVPVRMDDGSVKVFVGYRVQQDRKSTRLNSSHLVISYAVFCLKKKKKTNIIQTSVKNITPRRSSTVTDAERQPGCSKLERRDALQ